MIILMLTNLIAYIGPETILPLTSAIAAIGGGAMLFWNTLRRFATRAFRGMSRKATPEQRG